MMLKQIVGFSNPGVGCGSHVRRRQALLIEALLDGILVTNTRI